MFSACGMTIAAAQAITRSERELRKSCDLREWLDVPHQPIRKFRTIREIRVFQFVMAYERVREPASSSSRVAQFFPNAAIARTRQA